MNMVIKTPRMKENENDASVGESGGVGYGCQSVVLW